MHIYNTLKRQVEPFSPQRDNIVRLYTCGPTVYNYYHIGNLRNAIFNDTLRRCLTERGYDVKHVMNITDVGHLVSDSDEGEDKLEKGATREGKSVWDVAKHYTEAFKADMQALNVLPPNAYHSKKYDDTYARATEFIDDQLALVSALIDKKFAYVTATAIYFDVSKLKDYGELSGQRLQEKEVGARADVVTDKTKHSPHDFAVWFFTVGHFKDHTMHWASPWGDGFPGWHLECSAIIHKLLGDPIDIHTGGIDHIGTHHPNEMAQTEAAYGHPLAHYWVHNEFVLVDGKKMSKSKHNAFRLKDITQKGYSPLDYRLLVLQAHYRTELHFSWASLTAAKNRRLKLQAMSDLRFQPISKKTPATDLNFAKTADDIAEALADDLNTPGALEVLGIIENQVSEVLVHKNQLTDFEDFLHRIDSLLGLQLTVSQDITDSQKSLLAKRAKARETQDWAQADALRKELQAQRLDVRDTLHGQIWSRL